MTWWERYLQHLKERGTVASPYGSDYHIEWLEAELDRLQALNESLAERVAGQSELLTQ